MQINSNIDIQRLLTFKEVGYLPQLLSHIKKSTYLQKFDLYIYFKKTKEKWSLDTNFLNKETILFIVVDENGFVPEYLSNAALIVFKTYLTEIGTVNNVFHLPVGDSLIIKKNNVEPVSLRKTEVFFSGNLHAGRTYLYKYLSNCHWIPFSILHRIRDLFQDKINRRYKNSYLKFTKKFASGLGPHEYLALLLDSKIVLCPPGNPGIETLRHYEALKVGCIIISEKLPSSYCFNNSPIIILDKWQKLDETISSLLSNPVLLSDRQNEVIKWWDTKCSEKATLNYIIEKVKSIY